MPEGVRAAISEVRARSVHLPVVTATAIAAVMVTAIRYGVFANDLSLDVGFRYGFSGRALSMGHWSTLVTSQFLTRDGFMAISISLSLALMLGVYEAIAGSRRALVVVGTTALAGPLLVAAGLGVGSSLGNAFSARTLSTLDYGASAITAGAGGALVAVLAMRRLRWFAIFWVTVGLVLHHQLADWEHLGSFVTGYGLGHVLGTAPAVGSLRRQGSWFATTVLAPTRLIIPAAAVSILAGAAVAGSVVPSRTQTGSLAVGLSSASPVAARLLSIMYPSPSLGGRHQALVVLPVGYDASAARYPVVEMLHGRPGAPSDIITGFDPIGAGSLPGIPPFIGIVPDGHGPVVFDGEYADTSRQRLGAALSDDLRRYVGTHYRTNGHWSVSGLSSGGYGAAYLGARTPGQYDSVCSLSGNFTPQGSAFNDQKRSVLDAASPILHARPDGPRTLLIAGRADSASVREASIYARALSAAGETVSKVVVSGGHNWVLWKREFPRCLRFMLAPTRPGESPGSRPTMVTLHAPTALATRTVRSVGHIRSSSIRCLLPTTRSHGVAANPFGPGPKLVGRS